MHRIAVATARLSAQLLRASGLGGGTALPGLVALWLDPTFVEKRSSLLCPRVVVSGTNGKTTTARVIAETLAAAGHTVVSNQAGSNLMRGVAAALAQHPSPVGKAAGVFEADEFALPEILSKLRPHVVVLLNLFRDQLDRYGEVETIRRRWLHALSGRSCLVIANGDDPLVADVVLASGCQAAFFGSSGNFARTTVRPIALMDVVRCPRCGERLERPYVTYGHLGDYRCPQCGFARPACRLELLRVQTQDGWQAPMTVGVRETGGGHVRERELSIPLRGMYVAYNAAAGCLAARTLGVGWDHVAAGMARLRPAFGRGDVVEVDGTKVVTALVKNPTGFEQALLSYVSDEAGAYMVAINDLTADGRDVSWLWDVDFAPLVCRDRPVVCSGLRAEDMALRLKYAGLDPGRIVISKPLRRAVDVVLGLAGRGGMAVVFPTYTALLELRRELQRRGAAEPFWRG